VSRALACTIVANNYLAYARVLAQSFLTAHPEGEFHVLVVDRRDPTVDYESEPFTSWFAEEIGIPDFLHLAFRYTILELSTAVKPWFLLHLHRQTGTPALLYFDPDILVLGSLAELYMLLERADVVMTPHITAPIEDDRTPGERDFLLSGIFNLGFLGVAFNERTLLFLDWWHRRLERYCLHSVESGLFVDQRWMDFALAFLERVEVLREPGWNVAYWNLLHHRLESDGGEWRVDGRPLRFFHFSGYSLERPRQISRYQNRLTIEERPDIEPLFAEYARRLGEAGHMQRQRSRYAFGHFDSGAPVPELARALLRTVDPAGKRWPDPFRADGNDSFYAWISAADDATAEPFIPRIAAAMWESRSDLRQVFPSLRGPSRLAFAHWLVSHGDHDLASELLVRVDASLRPPPGTAAAAIEATQRRVWHVLARHAALPHEALSRDELESLAAEASADDHGSPRFTRLGLILHRMRADLRATFPDPAGNDRVPFSIWFVTSGRFEYDLPWALLKPVWRSLGIRHAVWAALWSIRHWWRRRPARREQLRAVEEFFASAPADPLAPAIGSNASQPDGLNVIGWVGAATGVGEACRGTLAAVTEVGIPHAVWSLGEPELEGVPRNYSIARQQQGAPYEVDLLHVNADMMEVIANSLPHWATAGRHRIGYWFWELSHFPIRFASAFDHCDEVWAPTRFCLEAFAPLAPVPLRWMPPSVPPRVAAPMSRAEWGVPPDCFLFLFAFDARSVPERKNPRGLLAAFARAVRDCSAPLHLLIKVNHGREAPDVVADLTAAAAGLPVTISTATVSRGAVDSLLAGCDAFVSVHRSEGLGLPLIEAMQLGRPVVATGYGGCCDFLDQTTGWVVDHSLVPLRQAHGPYPAGAVWAEPDLGHAAEMMVRVVAEPEGRTRKIEAARRRVHEIYAPSAAGERIRRELDRILASRRRPARSDGATRPAAEPLGGAPELDGQEVAASRTGAASVTAPPAKR
jgi:glycosyltransferase involved in cell wall biosynthesis